MKNLIIYLGLSVVLLSSCSDSFSELEPYGGVNQNVLATEEGVNEILVGAYSMLDGISNDADHGFVGGGSGTNWVFGDMVSDDAYKGDETGPWADLVLLETFDVNPANDWLRDAWQVHYDAVSRSNNVLEVLALVRENGKISEENANQIEAEARFLRAWYHFQLRIKFRNIPYITEDVDPITVSNDTEVWDLIEEDIQWGIDNNMDDSPAEVGRASRWAAKAFKARVHLFQQEFNLAKPLLDDIINNGPFMLMPEFEQNFHEMHQNNAESIFEIQYSVNDGGDPTNSGQDHQTLFPNGLGLGFDYCPPSFSLFNAFKVDADGLPMHDTYLDNLLVEDMGVTFDQAFTPTDHMLDPRVDWTIGRRGIPFLDWGPWTGSNMKRFSDQMGPFSHKKLMFYESNRSEIAPNPSGHWSPGVNATNFSLLRLSHVILWRAEVAVEENDLALARDLVNQIRARAADDIVMGRINNSTFENGYVLDIDMTQPAANYNLGMYPSFPDQEYGRKAVRFEMRLEFAMEGMRFFDLVRWGIAEQTIDAFVEAERNIRTYNNSTDFVSPKHNYWPIPAMQIDLQFGVLQQDPNY
ncbi:MAG: RagB/SusD family nutrient uptake outer membrane protein [Cyclobacteriaceae bacterium]